MEEKYTQVPDRGFTHGSKFHSDDVFATALLRLINPEIQIERGFEIPEDYDGIVYDIGRGRYDHHQSDKEYRDNGVPYAAFGLLWRDFGHLLLNEAEVERFDQRFVQPLDESDNTGCDNMVAEIIAKFNPGWDSDETYDECFWKAEFFAEQILRNHLESVYGIYRAKETVEKAMKDGDGDLLVLPCFAPWKSIVVGSSYLFTIYPSNRGGYSIQGVPVSMDDNTLVCSFPEEWWGKTPEELREDTGIEGFRFCHANGFLCTTATLEEALEVAQMTLERLDMY